VSKQCHYRVASITPPPAATLTPTPPAGSWVFCANEGQTCTFTGTKEVRFGANGSYIYKTLTNGIPCTTAYFGDPIYGVAKQCYYRDVTTPTQPPGTTLTPTPPAGSWVFCANEGQICTFTGTKEVRFGANGVYFNKTLTNGTPCTTAVFGDPIYGVAKQCSYRDVTTPTTPPSASITPTPPTGTWVFCANEGQICTFTGTKEIIFGANGAYFYRTLTNGTPCANYVFGDPIYGVAKQCFYQN
jgi:hypothetical protein